jgi:hypothetical protein
MKTLSFSIRTLLAALLVVFVATSAAAQDLVLDNFVVANEQGRVTVRFGLTPLEVEAFEEMLRDGSVLELRCEAAVWRERILWWDEQMAEGELAHRLHYDALEDLYVLSESPPWPARPPRRTILREPVEVEPPEPKEIARGEDLAKLANDVWSRIELDAGPWVPGMTEGGGYLELDLVVVNLDIPVGLRTALFFWPWEVVPPTTYRQDLGQ